MAYLFALLLTLLRTIGTWMVRLFWNQIILWFAMTAAAWVIQHYGDEMKKAIISFNDQIKNTIFDARTYIEELEAAIAAKIDEMTGNLADRIAQIIQDIASDIPATFGVEEWFDGFRARVAAKVGIIVHDAAFAALSPVRTAVERLHLTLEPIVSDLSALDQEIKDAFRGIYDRFYETLNASADRVNQAAAGLIDRINGLADILNGNVATVKSHVDAQIEAMNALDLQMQTAAEEMAAYLLTHAPTEPLSPQDAQALADAAVSLLPHQTIPDHLTDIDWPALRPEFPDASTLEIDIDLPQPEDLPLFGIEGIIESIDALCSDLAAIQPPIDALATEIEARFRDALPFWLSQDASAGIKMILGAAAIEAILIKREQILEAVEAFKAEITATRTETGADIVKKTAEIKQKVLDLEKATIGNLPQLLQPASDRYKRELEDQIVKMEEVVLVNIDKIAPPGEIDHILESFPADLQATTGPGLSDSEKFSITDIYRILCGYFSRAQRIALISYIIRQDSESKLEEIIVLPAIPENSG